MQSAYARARPVPPLVESAGIWRPAGIVGHLSHLMMYGDWSALGLRRLNKFASKRWDALIGLSFLHLLHTTIGKMMFYLTAYKSAKQEVC